MGSTIIIHYRRRDFNRKKQTRDVFCPVSAFLFFASAQLFQGFGQGLVPLVEEAHGLHGQLIGLLVAGGADLAGQLLQLPGVVGVVVGHVAHQRQQPVRRLALRGGVLMGVAVVMIVVVVVLMIVVMMVMLVVVIVAVAMLMAVLVIVGMLMVVAVLMIVRMMVILHMALFMLVGVDVGVGVGVLVGMVLLPGLLVDVGMGVLIRMLVFVLVLAHGLTSWFFDL